ncbi:MAG: hypothetical protein AB7K04_11780 [Pseudorhodoplanes sp.]
MTFADFGRFDMRAVTAPLQFGAQGGMMKRALLVAPIVVLLLATVEAEEPPAKMVEQPPAATKSVRCRELFQKNDDGSWRPIRLVTVNGVTMRPGASIRSGVAMRGIDNSRPL